MRSSKKFDEFGAETLRLETHGKCTVIVIRCRGGCGKQIRIYHAKDSGKCPSCSRIGSIKSELILGVKDRLVRVDRNSHGKPVYRLRCLTPGCDRTVSAGNRSRIHVATCKKCADGARKSREFWIPFIRTRADAGRRGLAFTLSFDEFEALCKIATCHYCGCDLNRSDHDEASSMLDRKDNQAGYEVGNCVPCCPTCNWTKGRYLSHDEMMMVMRMRSEARCGASDGSGKPTATTVTVPPGVAVTVATISGPAVGATTAPGVAVGQVGATTAIATGTVA